MTQNRRDIVLVQNPHWDTLGPGEIATYSAGLVQANALLGLDGLYAQLKYRQADKSATDFAGDGINQS